MSIPKTIFIDTSVFDEQSYNFSSSSMSAFLDAAKGRTLSLLMPDPTEREIRRHIEERSNSALKALEDAKRRAPFLSKWKEWPVKKGDFYIKWELSKIANAELKSFLDRFDVIKLDYQGINIKEIMNWYDQGRAPFGSGKKRKEFPDALALACILKFADSKQCQVAIVSKDEDHKNACSHYTQLLFFPSLAALTESFLSEETRIESLKALIKEKETIIVKAIEDGFPELSFYPEEEPGGDVEDVTVDDVEFSDLRVVAIGDYEVTIVFIACINYSAFVSYSYREYGAKIKKKGTIYDWEEIGGTAKLTLNKSWHDIVEISRLEFENDDVCVRREPDVCYDEYDDYRDEY